MAKRTASGNKIDANRWLGTYADLMNNLLVFFMLLYIMSVVDLKKFQSITASFSETFLGATPAIVVQATPPPNEIDAMIIETPDPEATETPEPSPTDTPTPTPSFMLLATPSPTPEPDYNLILLMDEYNELFIRISKLLKEYGYESDVTVEKKDDIIYLRFREGVFFFPDSPTLKETAYPILKSISEIILDSYDLISTIDISGHTAKLSDNPPSKTNLFSWELSSDRALTVLKYLVQYCDMPQEKLSVTGYSCNQLYAVGGYTEEYLKQNRRVEIRLSQKKPEY